MQQPRASATGTTDLNPSGGGLARYRSAPATWLEALLESDDDPSDALSDAPNPSPCSAPAPPPTDDDLDDDRDLDLEFLESTGAGGFSNFLRQNSSPAEFLSLLNNSDGYFSNLGISANYDFASLPSAKRARRAEDMDKLSPRFSSSSSTSLKGENGGQLQNGGTLDADMEKLLEDSVMCRVRAKRGCATHPRSIAERVRRTRISDRIRKLQELVPNMDKVKASEIQWGVDIFCCCGIIQDI